MQSDVDLNLLVLLDAVLTEGSVTGAARRLNLSVPAASRGLDRVRRALGDPVMVRAGRGLVPTARALTLQDRIHELVIEARLVMNDVAALDLQSLTRDFLIVNHDLLFTPAPLIARIHRDAPAATVSVIPITGSTVPLRESVVDLVIGVVRDFDPVAAFEPEVIVETIQIDRMVGIGRADHPLFKGKMTPKKYLGAEHVVNSRRGRLLGPIDHELAALGHHRRVVASTSTTWSTVLLLLESDLLGGVSERVGRSLARFGLQIFELPFEICVNIEICQAWHPRHGSDAAHTWLRQVVREMATQEI